MKDQAELTNPGLSDYYRIIIKIVEKRQPAKNTIPFPKLIIITAFNLSL